MGKEIINQKLEITCLCFIFLIVLSFISQGQMMQKCPAYPDTIRMLQQENYFLECFIRGDENFSLITTIDGFPLIENKNGKFEYAIIDSAGEIYSTEIRAKNKADRTKEEISLLKSMDKKAVERIKPTFSKMTVRGDLSYSIESFPTSGTRNLLVLLVDFTDLSFQISNNNFNNLMNQANYNGTGSFKDYWLESSYSNLTVNSTVRGWYHAANNMAYYGTNSGGSDVNPRLLVQEAVDAAENAGLDFSIYDNDNDGNVDGIIVIHAGYGEEAGGGANTIWSHHWTLGSYKRTYDGVIIDDYALVPELRNNFGSNISNIGVICHEFGHSLGLPDLYDTDLSDGDSEGIGEWGLMGSGNWNNNGTSPSNLCVWSKFFLNWSNPVILSSPISISLPNSAQNNTFYRINTPHANEYFLLENRQFVGFDVGLPGTGLAIWHINTSKTTTSHINANDVNADENLKGVDLEEADGNLDLDNNTNRGDDGDLFPGNSCNLFFRDNTTPSSQTYSPVVNTNKPIANIAISGNNIRFDFMGYNPISGPTLVCSTGSTFSVSTLPQVDSIIWSTGPYLTVYSGQNTNLPTIKATGSGSSWVSARLVTACGSVTLPQKTVWAGKPNNSQIDMIVMFGQYPYNILCANMGQTIAAGHPNIQQQGIESFYWDFGSWSSYHTGYDLGGPVPNSRPAFYLDYYAPSPQVIKVKAINQCDNDYSMTYAKSKTFYAQNCFGYFLVFSPNPADSETTLSIETTSAAEIVDETAEWELEVYSPSQALKEKKTKLKGSTVKIQTAGWKEGVYVVRVKYKDEVLTDKLVVKK